MILALDDAYELMLFQSVEQANVYCETIDVENGIYKFWNDQAQRLKPTLPGAERQRGWRSIWSRSPEKFDLEPTGAPDPEGFAGFLGRARSLAAEPATHFTALAQAKAELTHALSK